MLPPFMSSRPSLLRAVGLHNQGCQPTPFAHQLAQLLATVFTL